MRRRTFTRRGTARRTSRPRVITAININAAGSAMGASGSGSEMTMANVLSDVETVSAQDLVGAKIISVKGIVWHNPSVRPTAGSARQIVGFGFRMLSSLEAGLPIATRVTLYGPYTSGRNLQGWVGRHCRMADYVGATSSVTSDVQTVTQPIFVRVNRVIKAVDEQFTFIAENTSAPVATTIGWTLEALVQLP